MPKLGMIEGDLSIIEWKVKEGDTVGKGQVICVVEGQKITNDVEAETAGVIRGIYVPAGKPSKIGTVIAIIAEADEDISALVPAAGAAEAPAAAQTPGAAAPAAESGDEGPKASPSAAALAKEKNVKLSKVASALGISRRITVFDIEEYLEKYKDLEPKCTESRLTGMRKVLATRMMQSSHGTAPVTIMRTADVTALKKSRDEKKAEFAAAGKAVPSFNDFLIKASALALKVHPALNATYENETLCVWENISINMAVAVPAGLTVPVIRDVDKKTVSEINAAAKDLAKKAEENKLSGDDLAGGTFCVTNLGMMDVEYSTPIINPPEVAILGVGTIKPYLVLADGQVTERYQIYLSLTVDHRIVDGAPGAAFLKTLAEILQDTERLWG
jgi:pyruvate dehydrogenase E2 component (dihydrolipoamide acetyltransferase)